MARWGNSIETISVVDFLCGPNTLGSKPLEHICDNGGGGATEFNTGMFIENEDFADSPPDPAPAEGETILQFVDTGDLEYLSIYDPDSDEWHRYTPDA